VYYAETLVTQIELELFNKIRQVVVKLKKDSRIAGLEISCHAVARAFGNLFNLEIMDGYFRGGFMHSWLRTSEGNVIDLYPPFLLNEPVLVVCKSFPGHVNPWHGMYQSADLKLDLDEIEQQVTKLDRVLEDILASNL